MTTRTRSILAVATLVAAAGAVPPQVMRFGARRQSVDEQFELDTVMEFADQAPGDGGKRPSFTIRAYNGGVMRTDFSYYPVVLDLRGGKSAGQFVPILYAHDEERPVGQSTEVEINASGVTLKGQITGEDDTAKMILAHARNGYKWQASVGVVVERQEFLSDGAKMNVNGKEVRGPLVIARAWTMRETSILTVGADKSSTVRIAARMKRGTGKENDMRFEDWLAERGITSEAFDAMEESKQKKLRASYHGEMLRANAGGTTPLTDDPAAGGNAGNGNDDEQGEDAGERPLTAADANRIADRAANTIAERLQRDAAANATRIEAVIAATEGSPTIRARALRENWTGERAELEVLRAGRPQGPFGIVRGSGGFNADVVRCAVLTAGGLRGVESMFDDKTNQAAHTQYRGRIGLQQLLLEAAWAGGHQGMHFDTTPSGMHSILKASFSNLSLPGIFANTANKFLLQGFMAVEQAWRAIAARRNVKDFKQITSYRMTGAFTFEEVAPGGELEHATVGEESFTNQAKTYGKMFAITRQDIINDDLGALTDIPQRIGRGGALKFNSVFWTEFLAGHNAFFPTNGSKNNYISGASSALGSAGLKLALETFRRQTDPDGNPLGVTPAWMLVPPELEAPALELNRSVTVNTGGASTQSQVPNSNIYGGRFPPVVSAYLQDSDQWYLGADPAVLAVIEACFLNGQEQPTVETADADFSVLGVQMRGYWDFGVKKQDSRAAVKSAGT